MTARLVDTGPITYLDAQGRLVWRPCRTWLMDGGHYLSVVTELGPGNTRIDEAALQVRNLLEAAHPGYDVHIVEHYPAPAGSRRRTAYVAQKRDKAGHIRWTPTDVEHLHRILPDLEATHPAGPVINGTWTMTGPPLNGAPS